MAYWWLYEVNLVAFHQYFQSVEDNKRTISVGHAVLFCGICFQYMSVCVHVCECTSAILLDYILFIGYDPKA